jgi:copper ion binding protein
MTTITYSVPNISCQHCVHTINTELAELPGVQSVAADLPTKTVKVSYDAPASPEKIEELLAEIDYPAEK